MNKLTRFSIGAARFYFGGSAKCAAGEFQAASRPGADKMSQEYMDKSNSSHHQQPKQMDRKDNTFAVMDTEQRRHDAAFAVVHAGQDAGFGASKEPSQDKKGTLDACYAAARAQKANSHDTQKEWSSDACQIASSVGSKAREVKEGLFGGPTWPTESAKETLAQAADRVAREIKNGMH
jgi:uncharacterized protein involved in copper resistance